jgi:hypothetical protein
MARTDNVTYTTARRRGLGEPQAGNRAEMKERPLKPLGSPVPCACGCGALLPSTDRYGKARRWKKGHSNRRPVDTHRTEVVRVPLTKAEVAALRAAAAQAGTTMAAILRRGMES